MNETIDVTNPELLLEDDLDARFILTGERTVPVEVVAAARNLARLLIAESPVGLARTIAFFAHNGGATPAIGNAMVDLLQKKIIECTPDQLNDIVHEAKVAGVWFFVKPAIMARNDMIAEQVDDYHNMAALDMFLGQLATDSENWLPGPVYVKLEEHLRQLAQEADITLLDAIADLASKWRLKSKIRKTLSARNKQLIASLPAASRPAGGYVLRRGGHSLLATSPLQVLRLVADGYEIEV